MAVSVTSLVLPLLLLVSGDAEDVSGLSTNLVLAENPASSLPVLPPHHKLRKALLEPEFGRGLQRVFLSDRRVTCNDGSPAGFYIRKYPGSRRWIIYLEGGMYCYDPHSCGRRWSKTRGLMSSQQWSDIRHVGGILSPNSEENPYWWNANHVLVPYCSSDSWSGAQGPSRRHNGDPNTPNFSFMGSYIVSQVVADLLPLGLANGSRLILAGSSAGGTGVLLNLDRVADSLRRAAPRLEVRGLADSGWFLDRAPYPIGAGGAASPGCREAGLCRAGPATLALQQALRYWGGRVPAECALTYPTEQWKCFFGQSVYPSMRAPLFVFQWLFDEAQMAADNVGAPVSKQQWDYIHSMGDSLRRSLENVTSVFVPSCISHTVLTSRDWRHVRVSHVSLPQALRCWEMQPQHHMQGKHVARTRVNAPHPSRHRHGSLANATWPLYMLADAPVKSARQLIRSGSIIPGDPFASTSLLTPAMSPLESDVLAESSATIPNGERGGHRGKRRRRKKMRKGERGERKDRGEERGERNGQGRREGGRNKGGRARDGEERPQRPRKGRRGRRERSVRAQCQFRVVERCSWPQCNHSCPKLHNPFTGEELDFIELLKSFGLDMSSVAAALGIDLHTLHNMEHEELLNLLTQQAN